jgi:hypothetical protein
MSLTLTDHSERAILLKGATDDHTDEIKAMWGQWNAKAGGWVFAKRRRSQLEEWLEDNTLIAAFTKAAITEKAAKRPTWEDIEARQAIVRSWWMELQTSRGLQSWQLCFNSRCTKRAGCCKYDKRTIEISSRYIVVAAEAEAKDTLLHEAAHALAGHKAGHGPEWKHVAQAIGCTAQRCHTVVFATNKAKAVGTCVCPGKEHHFHRLTKQLRKALAGHAVWKCKVCKHNVSCKACE